MFPYPASTPMILMLLIVFIWFPFHNLVFRAPIWPRPRALWIHLTPDSESGPWEFHPCASAQLFREVSLSCPTVVALPVASRHLRPVVVARVKRSWRRASRLWWGRMYQMNGYELVKVHGEGQYPFTYRGENEVLWGCFAKNIFGPEIPLMW